MGAPELSDRPFEEAAAKFAGVKWKLQVLDDAKSLVLAKAGRIDFINPEGAPIVYTLEQAGWTKLLDIGDLYKHGPGGVDSPIEPLVAIVGIGANAEYVNAQPNTVLRFLSVVWRTIDEVGKDPSLFDLQAPYLNSVAGTRPRRQGCRGDGQGARSALALRLQQDLFRRHERACSTTRMPGRAIIKNYAEHGIIPEGAVTPDQIIWAAPIWHQMVDYRTKTDALIKGLEGKTPERRQAGPARQGEAVSTAGTISSTPTGSRRPRAA